MPKAAAKKLHPDAGGDEEAFKKLQAAAEVLRRHHGMEADG
jgi:curved DNA-binding protein CbpA